MTYLKKSQIEWSLPPNVYYLFPKFNSLKSISKISMANAVYKEKRICHRGTINLTSKPLLVECPTVLSWYGKHMYVHIIESISFKVLF